MRKLIEASDLTAKADSDVFRLRCPELLQKLILTDAGELRDSIRAPSGSAGTAPGRDGHSYSVSGGRFVPQGQTLWEIGTGKDDFTKALSDFSKRADLCRSSGNDPGTITYVFVMFRTWRHPEDMKSWAEEQSKEGPFKQVIVFDAAILEDWLEASPGASRWARHKLLNMASTETGYLNAEESLEDFGRRYDFEKLSSKSPRSPSSATAPAFHQALLTTGYDGQVAQFNKATKSLGSKIQVAAETEAEAIAFACACIAERGAIDGSNLLHNTLVITSPEVIGDLSAIRGHVFILPQQIAASSGHRLHTDNVFVTATTRFIESPTAIVLAPRSTEVFATALAACGLDTSVTYSMSQKVGRSLSVLWREAPRSGYAEAPAWLAKAGDPLVRGLIMAGAFKTDHEHDITCLSKLSAQELADPHHTVKAHLNGPDPLLRRAGHLYAVCSQADALTFGGASLDKKNLDAFGEVLTTVFAYTEPKPEKHERVPLVTPTPRYSDQFKEGLAISALMMSTMSESYEIEYEGAPATLFIQRIIDRLIGNSNFYDFLESNRALVSLWAEASPSGFIEALDNLVEGGASTMAPLFQSKSDLMGMEWSHRLVSLMPAIGVLAWCGEHLRTSVSILTKLAEFDTTDSKHSPRPAEILEGIFSSWSPQTEASNETRLRLLREMTKNAPNVAVNVILSIMPASHRVQSPHSKPKFLPVAEPSLTWDDVWSFEVEAARVLFRSEIPAASWLANGLEKFCKLRDEGYSDLLTVLNAAMRMPENAALWSELSRVVRRHERFAHTDWALPEERLAPLRDLLKAFEPSDPRLDAQRFFEWEADHDVHLGKSTKEKLRSDREQALNAIWTQFGAAGIVEFSQTIKNPHPVIDWVQTSLSLEEALLVAHRASTEQVGRWPRHIAPALHHRFGEKFIVAVQAAHTAGNMSADEMMDALAGLLRTPEGRSSLEALEPELRKGVWSRIEGHDLFNVEEAEISRLVANVAEANVPEALFERITPLFERLPSPTLLELCQQMFQRTQNLKNRFPAREFLNALSLMWERRDVAAIELVKLELPFVRHHYMFKSRIWVTFRWLGETPSEFVEFIKAAYRDDDVVNRESSTRESDERTEEEKSWAQIAFWVVYNIDDAGFSNGTDIDLDRFCAWRDEVLRLAREAKHEISTLWTIARILAHMPPDPKQDIWPTKTVARLIDTFDSRELERTLAMTQFNNRGAYMGDGVEHALEWAERREAAAAAMSDFPVTHRFLLNCARSDRIDAENARKRREERELPSGV